MSVSAGPVQAAIQACWPEQSRGTTVVVGFSGGIDSTVLLHALCATLGPGAVIAAHIHHGLLESADQWLLDAKALANRLGCRFESVCLRRPLTNPPGGMEQWARDARRESLLHICHGHGAAQLALAHHADDQIETVLLNLGRGAGPAGMRGMAARVPAGEVELVRPLLGVDREQILAYAKAHQLRWSEDPSNADPAYRRNRVRHQLVPLLGEIFPGFRRNLLRHARIARGQLRHSAKRLPAPESTGFDRRSFLHLGAPQLDQLLHDWLRNLGCRPPTQARTTHIREQLFRSTATYAQISHDARVIRRYRDQIVLTGPMPPAPQPLSMRWQHEPRLALDAYRGELTFAAAPPGQSGIPSDWLQRQSILVEPLRMSARLRVRAGAPSRSLKQLCQEAGVPHWVRGHLPMLVVDGQVLFAAGAGMNADLAVSGAVEPVVIGFSRPDAGADFNWPL